MDITLVVVRPFGTHVAGDRIAAAPDIAAALASEHAHCVVAVHSVTSPAPTATGQ
jgi:hypothetical protein